MDTLRRFDLNLLWGLDLLLSTRSVSAAARALSVGQPAMSKTLQRLRDELGDPILVRAGREMVPTERGAALATSVHHLVEAARRAMAPPAPFVPIAAAGRIRLAMADDAQAMLLTALVDRVRRLAPGLDLRVRRLDASTRGEVTRGEVHLAIIPDRALLTGVRSAELDDFVMRPLYRDEFVVVSAARRPRRKKWTLSAYARAEHVLVTPAGDGETGFVDIVLERHGLRRRIAVTVPSFFEAARIAATTELVATLPRGLARSGAGALDVQPPPCALPSLAMMVTWHPGHATPASTWVREQLAGCASVATESRPPTRGETAKKS